jgi:hypothetical protein
LREGIGLGDDGDEVDPRPQTFHDLNVKGLQATEVEICKDTEIRRRKITCVP